MDSEGYLNIVKNHISFHESSSDRASITSVSVPLENRSHIQKATRLRQAWILLVAEFVEVIQIVFSIIYVLAGTKMNDILPNGGAIVTFVVIRVGLLVYVLVGTTAYAMMFVQHGSFRSCLRAWIYGSVFVILVRTAIIVFVYVLLNMQGGKESLSEDLEMVILQDFATVVARSLAMLYSYHCLLTRMSNLLNQSNRVSAAGF